MAGNVWERAAIEKVDELLKDKRWYDIIQTVYSRLKSGYYEQEWVDFVFQHFGRHEKLTLVDAYNFAQINAMALEGQLVFCYVYVGGHLPSRDSKIEEMNEKLSCLPFPFRGEFWGGNKDNDGSIDWDSAIKLNSITRDDNDNSVHYQSEAGGSVPLEVGFTSSSTTFGHIMSEWGLARWPYGYEYVQVCIRRPATTQSQTGVPVLPVKPHQPTLFD